MTRIVWDDTGERLYETGVNQGVLYLLDSDGAFSSGIAWNGLSAVNESPSGGEPNSIYADNIKYLELMSTEEFGCSIEAYTYPEEFEECDGSAEIATGVTIGQQPRKKFGFCYKTKIGNDILGEAYGYKLHLIYNCLAQPTDKGYQTINDSPEAITFSWEIKTTPVSVSNNNPTASLVIDSTKVAAGKLANLEAVLYGVNADAFDATSTYAVGDYCTKDTKTYVCITAITTAGAWDADDWSEVSNPGPRLPLPDEVVTLLS